MLFLLLLVLKLKPFSTRSSCLSFESLDRLQSTDIPALRLAFVYCDHTIQTEQTSAHLVGSLLAQLTNTLPYNNPIMTKLLKHRTKGRPLDCNTSIDYIRDIATSDPHLSIRLGVDGFDELHKNHRSRFLRHLARLSEVPNIHFIFFSRDTGIKDDVERLFQKSASIEFWQITEDLTVADRRLFLQEKLKEHYNEFDENLRTLIIEKLTARDST
jgi:hypothetical protein